MDENGYYTIVAMGMNIMEIKANGFIAYVSYNALNISAIMVITGVSLSLYRCLKNMQARAEQKFIYDFLPLYLLLFVSITGLALTVMNMFLEGKGRNGGRFLCLILLNKQKNLPQVLLFLSRFI